MKLDHSILTGEQVQDDAIHLKCKFQKYIYRLRWTSWFQWTDVNAEWFRFSWFLR